MMTVANTCNRPMEFAGVLKPERSHRHGALGVAEGIEAVR